MKVFYDKDCDLSLIKGKMLRLSVTVLKVTRMRKI